MNYYLVILLTVLTVSSFNRVMTDGRLAEL
jgi:hypothetical protein